ncbi:unnamed protein product [Amoebophrya sp. A120]|nr:unnamed protein product [Amoebophrya sp. A120]|eukprot:GSA120T00019063001.1
MASSASSSSGGASAVNKDLSAVLAAVADLQNAAPKAGTTGRMPFLDAKAQLMLSYLLELVDYLLHQTKGCGTSGEQDQQTSELSEEGEPEATNLQEDPSSSSAASKRFEQLYRIRLAFSRVKGLDQKLQYSIQKLLDTEEGKLQSSGARPSLRLAKGSLIAGENEDDEFKNAMEDEPEAGGQQLKNGKSEQSGEDKIYRPPKITSMEYTGYDKSVNKAEKQLEREQRRLQNTNIFKALKEVAMEGEIDATAVEVGGSERSGRTDEVEKLMRKQRERQAYEEDNLTRLRQTKQDKKDAKRLKQLRQQGGGSDGAVGLRDLLKEVDSFSASGERLATFRNAKQKLSDMHQVRKEAGAMSGSKKKAAGGGKGKQKGGGKRRGR